MGTAEFTTYQLKDGAAYITLNRPEARNALSAQLVVELADHLGAANADAAVRCIVITGAGSAFCAGADLKNPPGLAVGDGRKVPFSEVLTAIWEGAKPVVAAVNGPAFAGGLGLVGACDIVISAKDAVMSFSEVRIGVIPATIAVICLRKLGRHQGMRLMLTGERFSGEEAVGYGLVHRAVESGDLMEAVEAEVKTIGLGGPIAVAECKKMIRTLPGDSLASDFETADAWSRRMFAAEEGSEGMAAFREKRKPRWVVE